jgi:hypothetical protein
MENRKMINELYKLGEAMSLAGISPSEWHRQLRELRKLSTLSPCFKLSFAKNASVYNIEEITSQDFLDELRKWEPSLGNSFPAFNMPNLFSLTKEQIQQKDDWLSGKKHFDISLLRSWCNEKANNWDNKAIAKLENCIHAVPEQLKQKISRDDNLDNNSIMKLIRLLSIISVGDFRKSLELCIFEKLEKQENIKMLLNILISKKALNQQEKKQQKSDVQVILDLYDWKPYGNPVANKKTIEWLNSVLIKSDHAMLAKSEKLDTWDAFGCEYSEIKEPMPAVKLSGKMGDVKLRSMFHEHQCQYRYGLIDDASYPINKTNRVKIKTALEWLKEPDKEGKTWGMVDSEEILFAYPSLIPRSPIKLVSLMVTSSSATEARFESIAQDVIQTLEGLTPDNKVKNVQIFAIRKMDKARSKIVYFRNYNTEQIIKSAETWREGCINIPSVSFRVWSQNTDSEAKARTERIYPETPKPIQIAKIINKVWKMNGTTAGELKKVKYHQGLELLLEHNKYELAVYLLSVLILNNYGLIIYLGNLLHSGKGIREKFTSENYRFLPSVIGLLLYNQNRIKEEYMEDVPYLVGQILKISDELHAFYCKIVRDGNVPPQLVGSSLMASALETPERTLAQLAQRMNPYIAWAKQYRTKNCEIKGKESWRAAWYLGLYERNASIFKDKLEVLRSTQFGDREKAELFIGYLADFPKKEETANQSNVQ